MQLRSGHRTKTTTATKRSTTCKPRTAHPKRRGPMKVKCSKVRAFTCPARTITSEMSQAAFYRLIERLQAKFPHRTLYLHDDLTCRVTVKGETHDGRHQWVSPGGPRTTANIGVRYLGRNARGLDSEANAVRVTGGTVCLI